MGISPLNNNQVAFGAKANKAQGTKKPSKAKVLAGVAIAGAAVALGAGLATGKVKPDDVATFAKKAGATVADSAVKVGKSLVEAVKHPKTTIKNLPNKLWGLTLDAVGNGTVVVLKAKEAIQKAVGDATEIFKAVVGK